MVPLNYLHSFLSYFHITTLTCLLNRVRSPKEQDKKVKQWKIKTRKQQIRTMQNSCSTQQTSFFIRAVYDTKREVKKCFFQKERQKLSHKGHQKSHFEYQNREIKPMIVSKKTKPQHILAVLVWAAFRLLVIPSMINRHWKKIGS